MKGGYIMKRFTKSTTFDVNYLFNGNDEIHRRNNHKQKDFSNEAMFDVKDLIEK